MLVQEKIRQREIKENLALLKRFLAERGKIQVESISDWYDWFIYRKASTN